MELLLPGIKRGGELVQKPRFFSVLGNRDHLKITQPDGSVIKEPIWKYLDPMPEQFLTSLVYTKNLPLPPHTQQIFFDCGAWSYKHMPEPKWTPGQCAEMYARLACPGDLVASPDHMVLKGHDAQEEDYRINLTLDYAREFMKVVPAGLTPVGVVHGNTVESRLAAAEQLLEMGYRYLAIGGVAGRAGSRKYIHSVLEEMCRLRQQESFKIHVLGVSSIRWVREYVGYGIDSFDGSSMFFSAFTGATYYTLDPESEGYIKKYVVKDMDKDDIPICNCPVCVAIRAEGLDTRQMGSNERNMGRAVHNINIYMQALEMLYNEEANKCQLSFTLAQS